MSTYLWWRDSLPRPRPYSSRRLKRQDTVQPNPPVPNTPAQPALESLLDLTTGRECGPSPSREPYPSTILSLPELTPGPR